MRSKKDTMARRAARVRVIQVAAFLLVFYVMTAIALMIPPLAPYADAIGFVVLIVVHLVRPTGLLGKKRREMV